MIYNAADEAGRYSVRWVLFSRDDPTKVIARAEKPILEPEYWWEKQGQVPNVVFATALVEVNEKWYLYYGAADTRIGLAIAQKPLLRIEVVNTTPYTNTTTLTPVTMPIHIAMLIIVLAIAILSIFLAILVRSSSKA